MIVRARTGDVAPEISARVGRGRFAAAVRDIVLAEIDIERLRDFLSRGREGCQQCEKHEPQAASLMRSEESGFHRVVLEFCAGEKIFIG